MTEQINDAMPPEAEAPDAAALQLMLDEQKKKAAEYFDQLLRLKAEFENYRRRVEKEKADARLWGKRDVIMPLLQLVDVFEQALEQTEKATDVKQVARGLEFLHKNFASFLKAEGLDAVAVVGKPVDPQTAEVVEQVEVPAEEAGLVLSELQKGYTFQGRVLRPARVRVGVAAKGD